MAIDMQEPLIILLLRVCFKIEGVGNTLMIYCHMDHFMACFLGIWQLFIDTMLFIEEQGK